MVEYKKREEEDKMPSDSIDRRINETITHLQPSADPFSSFSAPILRRRRISPRFAWVEDDAIPWEELDILSQENYDPLTRPVFDIILHKKEIVDEYGESAYDYILRDAQNREDVEAGERERREREETMMRSPRAYVSNDEYSRWLRTYSNMIPLTDTSV